MINLFFSYSHADESLRNELEKHLTILKRQEIINAWHDRRITAGADLGKEINTHLKTADIILLLISSDFLASDYCYENEMQFAMERHNLNEAVVIPVILRPCDWHDTPFGKLMATPSDGKPIVKFQSLDEGFLEVTNEIKRVVNDIAVQPQNIVENTVINQQALKPRSSNLRITKIFSDHEKDKFLDDAFEYIANYFEDSLSELKQRNPQVEFRFKKVDSQNFNASIYINGNLKAECMIFIGSPMGYSRSISYSNRISQSFNSYNETLNVEEDGYSLYLKSTGLGMFGRSQSKNSLTFEGGAEYYWEMFIQPLQ